MLNDNNLIHDGMTCTDVRYPEKCGKSPVTV